MEKSVALTKCAAVSEVSAISEYVVSADGKIIGLVWSQKVHVYRGKDGWCRGVRLRDFYPVRWKYRARGDRDYSRLYYDTRSRAVQELLDAEAVK